MKIEKSRIFVGNVCKNQVDYDYFDKSGKVKYVEPICLEKNVLMIKFAKCYVVVKNIKGNMHLNSLEKKVTADDLVEYDKNFLNKEADFITREFVENVRPAFDEKNAKDSLSLAEVKFVDNKLRHEAKNENVNKSDSKDRTL